MWPDRRLCELLGIEHPIVQAPMAGSATPELAIAVSDAGGVGSLGCGSMALEEVRAATERMRAGASRVFNLNFFVHPPCDPDAASVADLSRRLAPWFERLGAPPPERVAAASPGFGADTLELLLALRPPVVSFHFGAPDEATVRALKQVGVRLMSSATTVAEARALEARGMDVVIAQGWEAGGHRGSHAPTAPADGIGGLALIPQVVDAVSIPVIAAGGVGDGRGVAATFALGACGVQMGTAFLSCPEAGTDDARRALLRRAQDTDTMMTDAISGRAARAVRSRFAEEMARAPGSALGYPTMYAMSGPIRAATDDADASFHLFGQAATLNHELPAAELMRRLAAEAGEAFAALSGGRGA